jgi:hypothetical protein
MIEYASGNASPSDPWHRLEREDHCSQDELVESQEVLVLRGAPPRSLDGGFNPALGWSRDGQQLASLNWDGSISIWSASPQPISPSQRWNAAGGRVFAWHLAEAEAAVAQAQTQAAQFHLTRLADEAPPDIVTLLGRARLFLLLGQFDRAAADYAHWSDTGEPDNGTAWLS